MKLCLASGFFILGCFLVRAMAVPQQTASIRGTVDDEPVTDARVILQSLRDKNCVKLFNSHKQDPERAKQLEACTQDVGTTSPDSRGQFQFSEVQAGWYDISVLWNMRHKPDHPTTFKLGDIVVMFPGWRDSTGRYDAYANGKPFYYSGGSDVIKNFDLTNRK